MTQTKHICVLHLEGQESPFDAKKGSLDLGNCLCMFKPFRSGSVDTIFSVVNFMYDSQTH